MIKKFLIFLLLFVMSISFMSCKGKNAAVRNKQSEADKIKGSLSIISYGDKAESVKAEAENFKKRYPNVSIQIKTLGSSEDVYNFCMNLPQNDDKPDIVTIDNNFIARVQDKKSNDFVDFSKYLSGSTYYTTSSLKEVSYNKKSFALPWEICPILMFYRKDILDSAGINISSIKTWDDFVNAGRMLYSSTSGKTKMISCNSKNVFLFRILLNQLGSSYVNSSQKLNLNSDESIKSMYEIKNMYSNNIAYDTNDTCGSAVDGYAAAVPSDISFAEDLIKNHPDQKNKWEICKLPSFENGGIRNALSTGTSIMVYKKKKQDILGTMFAKFMSNNLKSVTYAFKNKSFFPSFMEAYSKNEFNENIRYFNDQKIWRLFYIVSCEASPKIYSKNNDIIEKYLNQNQQNIINSTDISDSMNKANSEIQAEINKSLNVK